MSDASGDSHVDARGLRCPWPVLRLARALREGEAATLHADDPAVPGELAQLAAARGWRVTDLGPQRWRVERSFT